MCSIFYKIHGKANMNIVLGECLYMCVYAYTCVYTRTRICTSEHTRWLIPLGAYMGLIAPNSKQQIFNSATDVAV